MDQTHSKGPLMALFSVLLCTSCQQKIEVNNFRQNGPGLTRKMTGKQSWKLNCTKNKDLDSSFNFNTWSDERITFTGDYYQIEDQEFSDSECKNLLLTHRQLGVIKKESGLNLSEPRFELEAWRHFVIPNTKSPRYLEIIAFLEKQCGVSLEGKLVLDIEDDDCQSWFEEDFDQVLANQAQASNNKQNEAFELSGGSGTYIYQKELPQRDPDEKVLLGQ